MFKLFVVVAVFVVVVAVVVFITMNGKLLFVCLLLFLNGEWKIR